VKELDELRESFRNICDRIWAHRSMRTTPRIDAFPHVEFSAGTYRLAVTEGDGTVEMRETTSPDEVLYWLTSEMVLAHATHYATSEPIDELDGRRVQFARELDLFGLISSEWYFRKQQELVARVAKCPFLDDAGV